MKKLFAALVALALLLTACAAAEEALFYYPLTPPETSGDWAYRLLDDGTAEITHYNGDAKTLDIPSELEGHVVTSIGKGAFYFGSLTSVIIPDSVKTIEDSAFSSCYYLASVTIPDSVKTIRDLAFYKCQSLTSVTIPGSVMYIGENPFTYCENLTNISVSYDNEYLGVENGALFTKPDRRLVCLPGAFPDRIYSMPEGIQIIGDSAFVGCRSLESLIIPDGVTAIGNNAFTDCENLTSVTVPGSVKSIGASAFSYCSSLTSVNMLDGVTSIGDGAFYYCESLTSVTIPDSMTSIGDNAFYSCSSLTSVNIPSGVTFIGANPFADCISLTEISVSSDNEYFYVTDGVLFSRPDRRLVCCPCTFVSPGQLVSKKGMRIMSWVYSKSNRRYSVPEGTLVIGDGAFYGCANITSVTIPESVTSIGEWAFYNCEDLESVIIPDSVNDIGSYAFSNCLNLSSAKVPDGVTEIAEGTFFGCTNLTSLTIPDGVKSIGNKAFVMCSKLASVTIPEGVTSIGEGAFSFCNILVSVTIPDGVIDIGDGAFLGCYSLTSVTIPASVTSIGENAFSYYNEELVFTVEEGSYAEEYCKDNGCIYRYMKYDDYDALSRQLEQLGIHVGEDELKQLFDEGQMDYDQTGISGVLVGLGLGHYDYNTGVWSPTSNQIYAFDIEVFDEENMYSYFLQGVQSIIPDITITDIREDLSGLNEYHDGNRSVSFVCNGHSYSFTLTGMHDWFDLEMLDHMKRVIDAEKCPYKLYCFETNWNCFILFYGPKESADKFKMILP